ncbi:MAG: hypothetical protein JZU45_07615 [Methyloversatilis discipulorum]|uniref:hypothetical protein n=1 Tax=Methyloversatilis discipulorum TaxID=1119528 RepID=UPI0026F18451|nr:hypothetical protein [Methyloversatilis discipulorum]MBV5285934.1 hypothetical protein [Methyloversatilis discipulorum]
MNNLQQPERRASDVLYDEVAASRNSIRRGNIAAIKDVCDLMEKDGVQIAAAEVVRRCGPNGPAYSTVSNTGSKLGEYIKLRITEQASRQKSVSRNGSLADTVLDPVLQAQIRDKESVARWLQKENDALRTLLKTLRPGVDIDGAIANATKGGQPFLLAAPEGSEPHADKHVAVALLKLMDHLVGGRQYTFMKGRLTINKKVVLDSTEVAAYRRGTGLADDDWQQRYEAEGVSDGQR